MFGGIPVSEIDMMGEYWEAFPSLRRKLFEQTSEKYCKLTTADMKNTITENSDVKAFKDSYVEMFDGFDAYLYDVLIRKMSTLNISKAEATLSSEIFRRLNGITLVDRYSAYQLLDNEWSKIAVDLEVIQTEGFEATKKVNPNMVVKKKNGKDQEVQEGWIGHILPFDLIQSTYLKEDMTSLKAKESRLAEISSELEEIIDSLSEEEKSESYLNDDNSAFVDTELQSKIKEINSSIDTPELRVLNGYIDLLDKKANKGEKTQYVMEHPDVNWSIVAEKSVYSKNEIKARIVTLQQEYELPEDSLETKLRHAAELKKEEKALKKQAKEMAALLHQHTKETIENLSDEQAIEMLKEKWIAPLISNLMKLPDGIINELVSKLDALNKKYETTFEEVENEITKTEKALSSMIDDLIGNDFDMLGLSEFKKLLGGEQND